MTVLIDALYVLAAGLIMTGVVIGLRARDRQPTDQEPPSPPHPERPCDGTCDPIDDAHCGGLWHARAVPDAVPVPGVRGAHRADPEPGVRHEGATADYGPVLAGLRRDLEADTTGSLDADEIAWEAELRQFRLAGQETDQHFTERVERHLDGFAPDWRDPEPPDVSAVKGFDDALTLAGVHVMPAQPIDWSATGEWELVTS